MLTRRTGRERGVTMIEMMVGILVGLIVLWGMSTVYVNSARGSRTTTSANALNQDMRAVMDIMVGDIRRAGYWSTTVPGVNPFTAAATNLRVAADCVLYSYDATHAGGVAGVVNAGIDFFGFRWDSVNQVAQTLDPAANPASTATACNAATWQNLTDNQVIRITNMSFDTAGSQCMAYVKTSYNPTNVATFWPNNSLCDPATSVAPPGALFVETRLVNITLTASSVADPTLTRSLTEAVLVRNNRLIP